MQAIDQRAFNWLASQPEDVRKEFAPLVAMRFAAGVQNDGPAAVYMLWLVNQRLNRHLFDLYQHPDLCFRLLASCGQGRMLRRQWIKGPSRTATDNAALQLLAEHHPLASERELRMLLSCHSRKQFADFVADCGIDKDADRYMKAYGKLAG
jgi:hypothetical protein